MLKLGFTGTRNGATEAQLETLIKLVKELEPQEVYHGSCMGADAEFHYVVGRLFPGHRRNIYPSNSRSTRWYVEIADTDYVREPAKPLVRNQWIVDDADVLIGVSPTPQEILRSGTWATIRMARRKRIPIYIIMPDGSIEEENNANSTDT